MSNDKLPVRSGEPNWPRVQSLTPARIFRGRSGLSYPTSTQLQLRADHAAARDAVHTEIEIERDFPADFVKQTPLVEAWTRASDRGQFLKRPDLGRKLAADARVDIERRCLHDADVQFVLGDGLSAEAVKRQCPELLPRLTSAAAERRWRFGPVIFIHRCRVGVMNDVGDLIRPRVVVLLIGERPGLATAVSLSAYLAYCPKEGDSDAQRNLISNIHAQGVSVETAAVRIIALAEELLRQKRSGFEVKESLPGIENPLVPPVKELE